MNSHSAVSFKRGKGPGRLSKYQIGGKMKTILTGIFALALIAGQALMAGQARAAELKIGFVDYQKAINESNSGKQAKKELDRVQKKYQADIAKKVDERDAIKSDLDRQGLALSADVVREKEDQIEKLNREAERLNNDAVQEIQKKQQEKELAIIKGLKKVIDGIGKKENYNLILPADAVLYVNGAKDLTDEVIQKYNKMTAAGDTGDE